MDTLAAAVDTPEAAVIARPALRDRATTVLSRVQHARFSALCLGFGAGRLSGT